MSQKPAKAIFQVSTDVVGGCPVCKTTSLPFDHRYFVATVNHLLAEHGLLLEHVGQQSTRGMEGRYESTVAVLTDRS
jgi:hypothetical protein